MKNMKKPEVDVIRFKEEDIVAASNFRMTIDKFGNQKQKDGIVTFNNTTYIMDSEESVINAIKAMPAGITSDTQVYITNTVHTSLWNGFQAEANLDGNHPGGATAGQWNNTFEYVNGVFTRVS